MEKTLNFAVTASCRDDEQSKKCCVDAKSCITLRKQKRLRLFHQMWKFYKVVKKTRNVPFCQCQKKKENEA